MNNILLNNKDYNNLRKVDKKDLEDKKKDNKDQ
jgi:hypothetical protein